LYSTRSRRDQSIGAQLRLVTIATTSEGKGSEDVSPLCFTHLSVDLLGDSFYALKPQAAPGVDGVTWQEYETGLEDRLLDLHDRVHRGGYRAQPSRRVYIPKADGRRAIMSRICITHPAPIARLKSRYPARCAKHGKVAFKISRRTAFDLLLREILKLQPRLMSGLEQISSFLNGFKISIHND
jgi:hypothetical protein